MVTAFIAVASVLFILLFLIWSITDFFNLCVKVVFLVVAIWGIIILWPTLTAVAPQPSEIETSIVK